MNSSLYLGIGPLRTLMSIVSILLAGLMVSGSHAADPVVSNVDLLQRTDGSGLVDITYDLVDAEGDTMAVTLLLSDNGGADWKFPVFNISGDVGQGIAPGLAKNIVWDAGSIPQVIVSEMFQARVLASDAGVEFQIHSPEHVVITDFSKIDWTDQANIEKFSRAKLCLINGGHIWLGGTYADVNVVQQLKALNPDILILVYVSVKTVPLNGPNESPDSFWYKWYERTTPYFVSTTEGEMAQDFPGNRLINMIDPECRRVMIETVMEMQENSLNVVDGIYWDYFGKVLWIPESLDINGDPDMDGNGIGHWDDPEEMIAFRASHIELIEATRDSLGEGFIQFFNGLRAHQDSTFAALGDGAYYEIFPTQFFPDPDMQHALDPNWTHSLFNARRWFRTVNGGPYVVLGNTWYSVFRDNNAIMTQIITGDKFRAIALLGDLYSTWTSDPDGTARLVYDWTTHDISLGQPMGPPVFDGPFIRRDFQYGKVEIEMTTGKYPNPFDYRIWLLGNLVSELAIPYHTP